MKKILIQLIILSVLFAALTEDAEAIGLFHKKKAALLLKGAMLAKKLKVAKLALPKLKKVGVKAAVAKVRRPSVVSVPVQRPNSYELNHYVESRPAAWSTGVGFYGQPQEAQVIKKPIVKPLLVKPVVKKLALKKAGLKKLALKKGGLKKLGLLKKLLG